MTEYLAQLRAACLETLTAAGMPPSQEGTNGLTDMLAEADHAQCFVTSLGDAVSLEVEMAADVLGALAVLFDALDASHTKPSGNNYARRISAALRAWKFGCAAS